MSQRKTSAATAAAAAVAAVASVDLSLIIIAAVVVFVGSFYMYYVRVFFLPAISLACLFIKIHMQYVVDIDLPKALHRPNVNRKV